MCDSADRRVRKSRAAIFGALEELLQQKSYSSITVGDIIELADVGRTTFYAHFQTKDALFDELCKDIFAHVLAPMPEDGHSFSTDGAEEQLLHVLCRLSEQRERLAPLFSSPSSHLFWEAIEAHLVTFFAERIGSGGQVRSGLPDGLYAEHLGKTFCERMRGEDAFAAVVEEPQFSKVWLGQLGSDPTSSPARTMLVEAGVARAQAEAITLFHASGCLMVARSSFGKRDDWHLTRKAIDEFVSGGFARHPPAAPAAARR